MCGIYIAQIRSGTLQASKQPLFIQATPFYVLVYQDPSDIMVSEMVNEQRMSVLYAQYSVYAS